MPIVKVAYQNLGLSATWSAKSNVSTLPPSNLTDPNRQKIYRSNTLTSSGEYVTAALSSAMAIDFFGIVSGNLTTNATITFSLNTSDTGWAAPAFSTSLTPFNASLSGVLPGFLSATQTFKYARWDISDSGNPDGYLQFGVAFLGPLVSLAVPPKTMDYQRVDPSVISYAPSGTPKTYELSEYTQISMPFIFLPESLVFGSLQTAVRAMGRKKDVIVSIFSTGPSDANVNIATNLYGRFMDLPAFAYQALSSGNTYDWPVTFRESL